MDVILLERVDKLGAMGQTVKVKDGFARNFLLRRGKALRATEANKAKFERDRESLVARNADRRGMAEIEAKKLEGKSFVLLRQAGESGQLYGSVSPRDIAELATSDAVPIARGQVLLETPIKTIGLYTVRIAVHPEVIVPVILNVARTADEAAAQARGDVLKGPTSDREEAMAAAQALFAEETGIDDLEEEIDEETELND